MRSKMTGLLVFIFLLTAFAPLFPAGEVVSKVVPWSGWWWPRKKCQLAKAGWLSKSPLDKYEMAFPTVDGKKNMAVDWEKKYHSTRKSWHGHCNGWSAASIMEKEPVKIKKYKGIEFGVSDQKGLLTESFMVTRYHFFGTRYNGRGDNFDDIYPHVFQYLLMENIQKKGIPIVMDMSADESVWNYPVYAYKMDSKSKGNKVKVKLRIWACDDNVDMNFVGTQYLTKDYTYTLFMDDSGTITGSEWTGRSKKDHPDFVWIPYKNIPPHEEDSDENPWVKYPLLKKMFKLK